MIKQTKIGDFIYRSSETWCTVNPPSGLNDGQITISVTENTDTENSRTAYVTVSTTQAGVADRVITVVLEKAQSNK